MDASEYLLSCLKTRNINKAFSNSDYVVEENEDGSINKNDSFSNIPNCQLIINLINNLKKEELIEKALSDLSKQRENFKDIAVYLYYSSGTMIILY